MSGFFVKTLERLEGNALAFLSGTWKIAGVRGYTLNLAAHLWLSDLTGAGGVVVVTTAALAGKTFTGGVGQCAATLFPAPMGAAITCGILYREVNPADNTVNPMLYAWNDGGFPFTPNGLDVPITPNVLGLFAV